MIVMTGPKDVTAQSDSCAHAVSELDDYFRHGRHSWTQGIMVDSLIVT
jgi:hypothetical protein